MKNFVDDHFTLKSMKIHLSNICTYTLCSYVTHSSLYSLAYLYISVTLCPQSIFINFSYVFELVFVRYGSNIKCCKFIVIADLAQFEGAESNIISQLIAAAENVENLCRMDPAWNAWI